MARFGIPGYDIIIGNELNDTYEMTVNYGVTDIVDGGKGTDTLSYATADRGVNVTMGNTGQWGTTTADFVTLKFLNPSTGQYFQNVETRTVTQFKAIENVIGSHFDDTITGNSAANKLQGGDGHDVIRGGGGSDIIIGGRGADSLFGEDGPGPGGVADTFVFTSFQDSSYSGKLSSELSGGSPPPELGIDTIGDFDPGLDKIDLSAIDANSKISGNQDFKFLGIFADEESPNNHFTGKAGELFLLEYDSPEQLNADFVTLLFADIDGDAVADFKLQIYAPDSIVSLSQNDFLGVI